MGQLAKINLGDVTAYAYAVDHGYEGTVEQFADDQAHFAENATLVSEKADEASASATNADNFAKLAHSWAKVESGESVYPSRADEQTNNAWYWSEKARNYAERISGAITYVSSIYFADLPLNPASGDMYNIKDDFTTDSRFAEGAGIYCSAGTNVVFDKYGKWDLYAVGSVTSFNGRQGAIIPQASDYTPDFIGALKKVVGTEGQLIGFDASGEPIAMEAPTTSPLYIDSEDYLSIDYSILRHE